MKKKFIEEIKKRLLAEKKLLEGELKSFNWETKSGVFEFNPPEMGEGGRQEIEADEYEEAGNLLAIKKELEFRLEEIDLALKKIKENKYGLCEKCGKRIEPRILLVNPAARYCKRCLKGEGSTQ